MSHYRHYLRNYNSIDLKNRVKAILLDYEISIYANLRRINATRMIYRERFDLSLREAYEFTKEVEEEIHEEIRREMISCES